MFIWGVIFGGLYEPAKMGLYGAVWQKQGINAPKEPASQLEQQEQGRCWCWV